MKVYIFLLLCLTTTCLYGQKDTILPYRERVLNSYLTKLRSSKVDVEKKAINLKFREFLLETLQLKGSYDYPFSSLKTIGIIPSPDQAFKIINWNVKLEDESNLFYCFIVKNSGRKKKNKIIELVEKQSNFEQLSKEVLTENNWYGAVYYKIVPLKKGSKTSYTLLGWRSNATMSYMKLIETLSIQGNHVKLGAPIFINKTEKLKRVVFEYSKKATMSLRYEAKYERIIFDHLSPESPSMTGFYEYYVPDMSYDSYLLVDGKWVLKEDVIGVNEPENKTYKQTTIDPLTGKQIEKEVKKEWVDPSDGSVPGSKNKHIPNLPNERDK